MLRFINCHKVFNIVDPTSEKENIERIAELSIPKPLNPQPHNLYDAHLKK